MSSELRLPLHVLQCAHHADFVPPSQKSWQRDLAEVPWRSRLAKMVGSAAGPAAAPPLRSTIFLMGEELGCSCTYWKIIITKNPKHRRAPATTAVVAFICLAVYYLHPEHGVAYTPGPGGDWYSAPYAAVSHTSSNHLWMNVVMLLILGWFLEFTEGHLLMSCVVWGGSLIGTALHGAVKPGVRVRGLSGADYAVMWSQLSLLALNWSEMPLRWGRLFACVLLLAADVVVYHVDRPVGVSYESHLFGALAGVCISLCFGHNVIWRRWEVALVWLGLVGYVVLCVVGAACEQPAASGLAALLAPALLVRAVLISRRLCFAETHGGLPWPEDAVSLQQQV